MLGVGRGVWDVHAEYDGSGFRMFLHYKIYFQKVSHLIV